MTDIASVTDYKTYFGIKQATDDAKIQMVATSVSNLIKAYIGSSLTDNYNDPLTEVYYLDYDTNAIYLNNYPIRDITSVTVLGGNGIYPYDSTIHWPYTIGDDYRTYDGVIYRNYGYWPQSPFGIEVSYTTGYEDTPEDIKLAAILLMNYYLAEKYIPSRSIDSSSIVNTLTKDMTSDPKFPEYVRTILDFYKQQ